MSKNTPRNAPWSRPLAELIGAAIDPVLARQGFGESSIVLYWDEIVGDRLASMSEPLCLRWPPRGKAQSSYAPATLLVRVESGFALELQHLSNLIIERVNAHLGFACIGRVALKQAPLERRREDRIARQPPSPEALAAASTGLIGFEDPLLVDALTRLGARVMEQAASRKPIV